MFTWLLKVPSVFCETLYKNGVWRCFKENWKVEIVCKCKLIFENDKKLCHQLQVYLNVEGKFNFWAILTLLLKVPSVFCETLYKNGVWKCFTENWKVEIVCKCKLIFENDKKLCHQIQVYLNVEEKFNFWAILT